MTREEKLKQYIADGYKSTRAFCNQIGMPESTLRGAYRNGIGGMSVDYVLKICEELKLDIKTFDKKFLEETADLSPVEEKLIADYRSLKDDMKYFVSVSLASTVCQMVRKPNATLGQIMEKIEKEKAAQEFNSQTA